MRKMSVYEDYYKIKCETYEEKILSLIWQLASEKECNAVEHIELRQQLEVSQAKVASLKELNEQLQDDIINANMNFEIMDKLSEERRVALVELGTTRTWCYDCGTGMGNIIGGIKHDYGCDYVRLVKDGGEGC